MHKQFLPVLLAAFAVAKPQLPNLSGLPTCAQGVVLAQINTTPCGTDIACVCRDTSFIGNLRSLITAQCGESDATAAHSFYKDTCAQNGVTIGNDAASTSPAVSGATVTSTTVMPSSSAMSGSASMMSSVTGNPSVTASMIPSMSAEGSCTVTTTTVCHTATVAPTSTGMNPASYTGAADVVGVNAALAGLAMMAALL
jgi:CFEM domain